MVLERFNVPDEKAVLVPVDSMRAVVHELFLACGLDQDGAHGSLRIRPRLPVISAAASLRRRAAAKDCFAARCRRCNMRRRPDC